MQKLKNEEKIKGRRGGNKNKRNESKIKIIRKGLEFFFLPSLYFFLFFKVKMKLQGGRHIGVTLV